MPLEIERRFLIGETSVAPPDVVIERRFIVQTYLTPNVPGTVERVRVSTDAMTLKEYTHTIKREVSPGVNEEDEVAITEEEYGKLLMRSATKLNSIHKVRYTFEWEGLTWEYDVFTDYGEKMKGLKILEVELESLNTSLSMPPFLQVIREVTGERSYSNRALAED